MQDIAHNIAEVIEDLFRYTDERSPERRVELIAIQVRQAWRLGYAAGRARSEAETD